MSLFKENRTNQTNNEYVKMKKKPEKEFPVKRVVTIKPVFFNGTYYFRTRDVSDLLGMKQPFQFAADIREAVGDNVVLSGKDTEMFRTPEDDFRTTFISASNLVYALMSIKLKNKQKTNEDLKKEVIENLQHYL